MNFGIVLFQYFRLALKPVSKDTYGKQRTMRCFTMRCGIYYLGYFNTEMRSLFKGTILRDINPDNPPGILM